MGPQAAAVAEVAEVAECFCWLRYRRGGRYYTTSPIVGWCGNYDFIENGLVALAFPLTREMTFDRICVNALSLGDKGRMGIYSDDGDVYPANLILDAGELSLPGGLAEASIDLTLQPGLYWASFLPNTDITLTVRANSFAAFVPIGTDDPLLVADHHNVWCKTVPYGPLPNSFPTGASSNFFPEYIALRKKL